MNAKENARRIIEFDGPERVVGGPPCHGVGYLGVNHEGYEGGGHHMPVGSHWTDIWGTTWFREHDGVMGFPRGNPLADLPAALPSFEWPGPDDERICSKIYDSTEGWNKEETFLSGSHRDTLWEKSYMLVGMENMMCFFYTEPAARKITQGRMALQGGISTATIMDGPVEAIRREVVERLWQLGREGGYFCCPDQGMPFPEEHHAAFQQAVEEFGVYPLQPPAA